ncbi:MAG: hypothetical protein AB1466_01555 [Actinomycetota bacterium]
MRTKSDQLVIERCAGCLRVTDEGYCSVCKYPEVAWMHESGECPGFVDDEETLRMSEPYSQEETTEEERAKLSRGNRG